MNPQTEKLREKIKHYLAKQFICGDVSGLPEDECLSEANWILQACKDADMVFLCDPEDKCFSMARFIPIDLQEAQHD